MGAWAIVLAFICFIGPMAVPLIAQTWRSYLVVLGAAVLFFGWITLEVERPGTVPAHIGAFLAGLMLTGFAFGAIARFVMLVGRQGHPAPAAGPPSPLRGGNEGGGGAVDHGRTTPSRSPQGGGVREAE